MKKRLEGALEAEKRRNDRQQSRYKVLDDLAQANPDAVKSLLSQARAQVDLAKIREEFVRRVIDLPKLASEGIGAVRTFAMRGVSALTSWGGMDKVNWKQVEVDTYTTPITTTLIGLWKLWTRSLRTAREWPIRPFGQPKRG